jgi:hypothetical protein
MGENGLLCYMIWLEKDERKSEEIHREKDGRTEERERKQWWKK